MTTEHTTLEHLQRIAFESGAQITVDAVRRIAYLRRGRVRYVAPLAEAGAA